MNKAINSIAIKYKYMKDILQVSVTEFTEAIEELATHLANFSFNEQDYSVLLRYFSFGLHRLKSYRVRFEQEKNALLAFN